MTDRTDNRMRTIRSRTRRYRQRYENRQLSCLTACGLLLLAAIGDLFTRVQTPGIAEVADGYGAVLLRNGVSAYVMIGIVAFFIGAFATVLCIRLKNKFTCHTGSMEEGEKAL